MIPPPNTPFPLLNYYPWKSRLACHWPDAGQLCVKALYQIEPLGIVGPACGSGDSYGRFQTRLATAEKGSDQCVETLELVSEMQFPSNPAGLVAKALECRFTAPQHYIQALRDVALRQHGSVISARAATVLLSEVRNSRCPTVTTNTRLPRASRTHARVIRLRQNAQPPL